MDGIKKRLFVLFVLLSLPSVIVRSQSVDLSALRAEYPRLTERYADRLQSRSAHYVFAIDISSSMREYEAVVRQSLVKFVQAVPDGDQVTIIVMSDENTTNYLDLTKCITLDNKLRNSIISAVSGAGLSFKKHGDPTDGSDGFTMTRKVLEAMNVVNSSDLTFVYLLTDFEYWTHRNRYDKNAEDWASLKPMLTEKHRGMMCKYGIELTLNKVQHPEAIFKGELDNIFGPLDYQQAASAEMLSVWFKHIINDIQAHKINAMLKADWKETMNAMEERLSWKGDELRAEVTMPKSELVSGISLSLDNVADSRLTLCNESQATMSNDGVWTSTVARYEGEKTKLPTRIKIDEASQELSMRFDSPYAEEIAKLQGLCGENETSPDAVKLHSSIPLTVPPTKIWNGRLALWVYVLIALAIVGLLASFVYMIVINPKRRYTTVTVKRRANGVSKTYNGEVSQLPMVIGDDGDVKVPGATWTLRIEAQVHNPIISWIPFLNCKTGYYVKLENGDYADIINDYTDEKTGTVSCGKSAFLFPYKKAPRSRIEISEGTTTNRIEIN